MAGFDFTPDEERSLDTALEEVNQRIIQSRNSMSPNLASNMQEFYRRFPYAPANALVPAVQAYTDGRMSDSQVQSFIDDLTKKEIVRKEQEKKQKKEKSWWERNVSDKVKTASRYTMATLNFVPQFVQGGLAQVFDENDSVAGWFISTDLGSLISNDEVAGEGFFIGGRAAELQAERARRYRGTIDNHAWTLGRGVASLVVQPGSEPYRYLSGLVDAAAAIKLPAVPGGKNVTGAIKGAVGVQSARAGLRSLAGLTNVESAMIQPSKVNAFLNSRAGRGIVKKLADTNTVDEMMDIFPTASPTFLVNAAKITDETEMTLFLKDTLGLGDITRGIGPQSVSDINISRWDNVKRNLGSYSITREGIVQRENLVGRMMSKVPGQHVVVTGGSAREQMDSLKNIKNYLKLMRVDAAERQNIIGKFAEAFAKDDGSMKGVLQETQNLMGRAFATMGVPDVVSKQIVGDLGKFLDDYQKDLYGAINNSGDAADFGGRFTAMVDGQVVAVTQPLATAGLQSEMLKHGFMLPDPRRVRRLASNLGWLTGEAGFINPANAGKARMPLSAVEALQNEIWRPFTLLTGGYVVRNMSDSLLRMSFAPGVKTGIFHPLELIQVAMHKKFRGDILGGKFAGDPESLFRNGQKELAEAAAGTVRESIDPAKANARQKLTGSWRRVSLGDGKNDYMKGVAAELSLLATDDVARMVAAGDDLDMIVRALTSDPDLKYVKRLQNRWKNRVMTDQRGNRVVGTVNFLDEVAPGKFSVNDANLKEFISKYVVPRVEETTGNSPVLKQIIAKGSYVDEAGQEVGAIKFRVDPSTKESIIDSVSGYEDGMWQAIDGAIGDPNVNLKKFYKMQDEIDVASGYGGPGQNVRRLKESYDRVVDKFFGELYPKREAWLNRSPVFRQYYYKAIRDLSEELAPGQADELLSRLKDVAKSEGKEFNRDWLARYMGDDRLANGLIDVAGKSAASQGKLTLQQLDAWAKGYALDETKRLFYNAADKSNFADILRIVSPFGSAWAEVMNRWVRNLATEPETLKRTGVSVQGLIKADPDGDGKGFFYKDPNTGEYVFNYPFSEELGPLVMMGLTGLVGGGILGGIRGALAAGGVGAGIGGLLQSKLGGVTPIMSAPAKSLNMGLSILPGVGPYVQWAADKIIGDKPDKNILGLVTVDSRLLRKALTPYGTPDVSALALPAWADKMYQAWTADPETDRFYGDMKVDTMRALATSGKYDLETADGRDKLDKDSSSKARILLMLRALGQFTGPSRPTVEFKLDTKQGDKYAGEISKAFYEMQAENYDTAVQRFMETFGEDFFVYVAGKTKAVDGGLDATQEFGDWQVQNKGVFRRHEEVAGYFAPVGSTFDYQVYLRQLESGGRKKLTSQEVLAEAQARVGTAMYRSLVRQAGPNPNEGQQAVLRQARTFFGNKYPGFRDRPVDVGQQERRINQLFEAMTDKDLAGNPVAQGLMQYFQYRQQALAAAQARGYNSLGGKNVADLRAVLRRAGETIAFSIPEFERVWDRVLFNEVDL